MEILLSFLGQSIHVNDSSARPAIDSVCLFLHPPTLARGPTVRTGLSASVQTGCGVSVADKSLTLNCRASLRCFLGDASGLRASRPF